MHRYMVLTTGHKSLLQSIYQFATSWYGERSVPFIFGFNLPLDLTCRSIINHLFIQILL